MSCSCHFSIRESYRRKYVHLGCHITAKFFRALWELKLIGVSTNGAENMVGRFSGAVTRIINKCECEVNRACGVHQPDLAIQAVFECHVKATFQDPMHRIITFLRRQTNLISSMGSKCPPVITTGWISLRNVCGWFVKHRTVLKQYLDEKSLYTTQIHHGGCFLLFS